MDVKKKSLKLLFISCLKKTVFFLRDSGSEFETVGPKTKKDLFPKA